MAALAAAASLALLALALPSASASSELTGSRYHPVPDAAHRHLVGPFELDAAVDCAMRNLTYAFVNALLPYRAPLVDAFDALRLAIDCNQTRPAGAAFASSSSSSTVAAAAAPVGRRAAAAAAAAAATYYADAAVGVDDDQRSGNASQPFATPAFAVAQARKGARPAQVLLTDAAPFFLASPLILTSEDDGLSLAAAPASATLPVLSAGAPIGGLTWTSLGPAPGSGGSNPVMTVWSANISAGAPGNARVALPFDQLFLNAAPGGSVMSGRRATRARFPNGNPELEIVPNGWTKANATHGWHGSPPFDEASLVQQNPLHTPLARKACALAKTPCEPGGDSGGGPPWAIFCCFFWGWNATAVNFTTGSFWGTQGGPPGGGTAQMPGGMNAGNDTIPRMAAWTNWKDAIVHAFHDSYWGDWAWQLQDIDATTGSIAFSKGGWQEARGSGAGDYLYYENIRSELDWAGEWFVDAPSATLFYVANGTDAPPADGWVASQLDNVVSVLGDAGVPARSVQLSGLAFMHTKTTFMEPFEVPSGGDMSFHDGGAVRFRGTEGCGVSGSLFKNLGGSGVMIKDYNLDTVVDQNEFLFLGEHAVCSMGRGDRQDQLDGDFPTRNYITRNLAHEFGLYVKQTGFYYQGVSSNATISGNVFFNGPRAGININDGHAGGHLMSRNAGFNLVRETTDHGVFNSWDRNTYQAHAWDPTNLETLPIVMDQNLFICNYRAYFPIDNDDGSNAYVQTRNFLLWGGAKNLMGYNKAFLGNNYVYVDYSPITSPAVRALGLPLGEDTPAMRAKYPRELSSQRGGGGGGVGSGNGYGTCASTIAPWASAELGLADQFRSNVCIASSPSQFFDWYNPCNNATPTDGSMWLMSDNVYMSPDGGYVNRCNADAWNLTQAQALGVDVGSVVTTLPSTDELVAMGHNLLQF